ncbi:hypothetical protein PsorP6_000903 [Peronosclerospora sorghi]|uniref:Uncharacterized protein n=1 Tax=Peronosclerospora sorghi TaxID=230839 RepID=A0ACC0WQ44_9STRA|nr:hypothetical protein PsorP6_000903 [Peronosclerospora sorghi]
MNYASDTILETERTAFALPASLDHSPPLPFSDLSHRRFDENLVVLDVLGLNVPVPTPNAVDLMLFADPVESAPLNNCSNLPTPRIKLKECVSPRAHKNHPKKASRKQVHELQAMVNSMQVQVNGAAAEIQHLKQLVCQFSQQREQERRFAAEQQILFEENAMLDTQQQQLEAQVAREREQFMLEQQQVQNHQFQLRHECSETQLPPSTILF